VDGYNIIGTGLASKNRVTAPNRGSKQHAGNSVDEVAHENEGFPR